jgi:hypothetical protein
MASADGPKYEIDAKTRRRLHDRIGASGHAEGRHRERAPHDAAGIYHALKHAVVDEQIVAHEFWRRDEVDREPPDAIAVYRGRTGNGTVYTMAYPIAYKDRGLSTAITASRARGIPAKATEIGLADEVATALRAYIVTLSQQGGVVDE